MPVSVAVQKFANDIAGFLEEIDIGKKVRMKMRKMDASILITNRRLLHKRKKHT